MPNLTSIQTAYVSFWIPLTFACACFMIAKRRKLPIFQRHYANLLIRPWKLATFVIATAALSYFATFGFDPSWDIPETLLMSALTFWLAPFSVGVAYRYAKGIRRDRTELFIATVLLFFSSSWFYDAYAALFLLGEYPTMAFANLGLSPFFYVLAGMFWSLECDGKHPTFAFARENWLESPRKGNCLFQSLWIVVPIMLFMMGIFGSFAYLNR